MKPHGDGSTRADKPLRQLALAGKTKDGRVAVTYRCDTCGAYDPQGGGYWPIDRGPWYCRLHFSDAVTRHSGRTRIERRLDRVARAR